MKKIFSFTKKNKFSSSSSSLNQDSGSVQSAHGYELKEKDLGKVHKAASVGDVSKLKQLVKKNDVNQPDKENRTALHIACANGHVEVVHFLVEGKAKLNLCDSQNRSALMKAVQCQHERCVSILLENHADPNLADTNGDTALHMAAAIPSISSAALLLEHRAAVDAQNKEGASPLTTAVRKSHVEMAEFLLKDGADINIKDQDQRTPLMLAAGNGHTCMVRLLLQFDADITLQDASGCTADSHAVRNQHHACSLLIIEHGTKKNIMLSPSHQLPSKSPLRGSEAAFSLGGPATDKDDAEDNSQSESASRASKSAGDDWPSSEEDDELDLTPEKLQKVNLKKLIASKKGENADRGGGSEGNKDMSQQPSTSRARSDSPEGSPEAENSEEEDEEEEEEDEEEEDDDEDDDDDEEEDDEDEDDEDEDEHDNDEDEDEAEDDDDEEQDSEEEKGDKFATVSLVPEKNPGRLIQEEPPGAGTVEVNGGGGTFEPTDASDCMAAGAALAGTVEEEDVPAQRNAMGAASETVTTQGISSIGLPLRLDLEDGFIVSAIRVETKFSDSDDSLGKVHEGSFNKDGDGDLPEGDDRDVDFGSDDPDHGDMVWNNSDDDVEVDQKVASGRSTVLARRIRMIAGGEAEDVSDGSLTPKDDEGISVISKAGKRRSSWGSSLDESDDDVCASTTETRDRNMDTFGQGGQGSEALPGPTVPPRSKCISHPEPHPDEMESSWDSKSASPEPKLDTTKSSSSPQILQPRNGSPPKQRMVDTETQQDSSTSERNSKDGALPIKGDMLTALAEDQKLSEVQQLSDDSWEDDDDKGAEGENANVQVGSKGSVDKLANKEGKSEEEKGDNSWDDDDDDDDDADDDNEPAQYETSRRQADSSAHGHISTGVLHEKKEQTEADSDMPEPEDYDKEAEDDHAPVSVICGDEDLSEDDMPNEKGLAEDKGHESMREDEPRLTTIVSLSGKGDAVSGGLDTEAVKQASCDESDEELPHTDIDQVHVNSPVELEDRDKERTEFRDAKEAVKQKDDSTEDDDEEEEEEEDDYRDEEEEGDDEVDKERSEEEDRDSPVTSTPGPENEPSKDKQRDFLSELGLEKGEEEDDSWGSGSRSESPQKTLHEAEKSLVAKSSISVQEENKEVVKDDVGRDSDSSGCDGDINDQHVPPKETEKAKWEPLSVLSKLEGTGNGKTDLMEELGLGDVDDLEARKADASDWDSASTTSRRTLPGRRTASSPGVEELPESSSPSPVPLPPAGQEQEATAMAVASVEAPPVLHGSGETLAPPPLPGPRSLASPSPSPTQALPNPQPRARKMAPQKPVSEEDSDWDSDSTSSPPRLAKTCNQLPYICESQVVNSDSPDSEHEPSPVARDREVILQTEKHTPEAGKEETKTRTEAQKPSASWDFEPKEEGLEAKKPETVSRQTEGSLAAGDGATEMEQQLSAADSSDQIPATRNPKRSLPADKGKDENPGDMELAEDFDELTQSSDTATDDSPTSGYHHASLLVQQLDSTTLDSRSMVKLQNMFLEYERSIQKARSRHGHLTDKVRQLEMERAELKAAMEDVKEDRSALERQQLELRTDLNNLKYQLKQEQENHRNASMMYNSLREKLKRTEEQQQLEVEEKQRVELTLRNMELDMRTLHNNMKQLEEDRSESQRLLAQERTARTMQENLLSTHLRKQQEIEEENRRNVTRSNEALSQLTEASDREKELLQQSSSLQEELSLLRLELERCRTNAAMEESRLAEEGEAAKERLEDARRDLKLNEEALAQTVFQYNGQLTALKNDAAAAGTRLEHERQARETLETELESTRNRLTGALQEAERCQAARTDAEKALLREKEEHQRIKDKHTGDVAGQRDTVNGLSLKLSKAEARANSLENEVHRATLQLTEKSLLLEALQRDKDQLAARSKELETALQSERDVSSRTGARAEATQERLAQAQSEAMLLRQQLEEAQNKGVAKERAVTDAQERFSDILDKLRADGEERVQLVEERSKELAGKAADLRDQVYKLEEEKNDRESRVRQLEQDLADSLKKLAMSEASLEVNTRYRSDLEDEKTRLLKDLDRLKDKVQESDDQYVQAERRINAMKSSLDDKDRELCSTAQRLQEALSASAATDATSKQLEEAVQRLEIENARLEAAAKQQSNKIEALQKEAQEAAMVRGRLEDLVTNLQGSKMNLEDQLSREVQRQSMLSHTAQDSQALWEEELKSRSKLGLRLAELEKEKGELGSQMEIEKKKVKKIAEQKKATDARLEQEMKRNTDLQKEMYRLRTLLKTAKKKYREHEGGGAEFGGSPMNSMRMETGRYGQNDGRIREQVDDLQMQLGRETSRSRELDKLNGELQQQLSSMKGLSRSNERLEKANRQLEEELTGLRRQAEAGMLDPGQAEQYRREAEDRARLEIRQKLEEVNLFLQTQAASQEALDQLKSANESNVRSSLEQRIRELEVELSRTRSTQQDSLSQRDSTRTELERYRQLYTDELRTRKSLSAKLERSNTRLSDANAKLLNERQRTKALFSSSLGGGGGGGGLDMSSLRGSPTGYGTSLGPLNRSLGLGLPLLSPMSEGHNSSVEDYLARMRGELERNISRELAQGRAELEGSPTRLSPVGSACGVELDPVSRATQDYLEVLKKNYMI